MGYYASGNGDVIIPSENVDEAYRVMCDLNKRDDLKRGFSTTGEKWFAWMATNYPDLCDDAVAILKAVGFDDTYQTAEGAVVVGHYDGKSGQEDLFMAAIAHLVVDGCTYEWLGEDGQRWRWLFRDGKMITQEGVIQWV